MGAQGPRDALPARRRLPQDEQRKAERQLRRERTDVGLGRFDREPAGATVRRREDAWERQEFVDVQATAQPERCWALQELVKVQAVSVRVMRRARRAMLQAEPRMELRSAEARKVE